MITASDSPNTFDLGKYYVILPSQNSVLDIYRQNSRPTPKDFVYDSYTNPDFLTVSQLRQCIKDFVDPSFQPV
jgi:UDP-N-acetylglucosamine 4,6-dehydratase